MNLLDDLLDITLALIAATGIIVSPIIAYLAGRRKSGSEVLLIDMDTLQKWNETSKAWDVERRAFRKEIDILSEQVLEEQSKRRAANAAHNSEIVKLRAELNRLREAVRNCKGFSDDDDLE